MAETKVWDVIVVGAGNAATCAALSAKEQGASVLMLEKAPYDERGGNSLFTAGGFRFVHDGLDDLRTDILDDLTEGEIAQIGNLPPHSKQKYIDDMSAGMGQTFSEVFRSRGYEVVTAPGPGVLRVTPTVTDLWLNAPDVQSSNLTRTFNRETADATLVVDARDSVTGAVLAHFVDRRTVRDTIGRAPKYTSDVGNLFWMESASRTLATNTIKEFEATPDRVRTSSAAGR